MVKVTSYKYVFNNLARKDLVHLNLVNNREIIMVEQREIPLFLVILR